MLATSAAAAGPAHAQCGTCVEQRYESISGLPSSVCYEVRGGGRMNGDLLEISGSSGLAWYNTGRLLPFLWGEGILLEATLRVPVGGEGFLGDRWRPAAGFTAVDSQRLTYNVSVWATGVLLSSSDNLLVGANTVLMPFDAASAFHTYSLLSDGQGATLSIDGAPVLRVAASGPHCCSGPIFCPAYIDTRFAGPVVSYWRSWTIRKVNVAECYANCDCTTGTSTLDVFDFLCFQNRYAQNEPYACDCDTSSGPGLCDIFDFLCYQNAFAAGCP